VVDRFCCGWFRKFRRSGRGYLARNGDLKAHDHDSLHPESALKNRQEAEVPLKSLRQVNPVASAGLYSAFMFAHGVVHAEILKAHRFFVRGSGCSMASHSPATVSREFLVGFKQARTVIVRSLCAAVSVSGCNRALDTLLARFASCEILDSHIETTEFALYDTLCKSPAYSARQSQLSPCAVVNAAQLRRGYGGFLDANRWCFSELSPFGAAVATLAQPLLNGNDPSAFQRLAPRR